MKFAFIEAEKATWPVSIMCRVLRVSRSGSYASQRRPESQRTRDDRRLTVLTREAHVTGRRAYGSPRIHRELVGQGIVIGRKRVIRLMKAEGIKGKVRRRFVRTTDSEHSLPTALNLLAREFNAERPNQRWVSDITYLRTPQGWMYLAAVLDLFSRYVVGWAVSAVIDRHLVLRALQMAIKRRCPSAGLLHHSDQGSQYASEDYQRALEARGITCSMSRRGNCYDNAAMESWFGTLKTELGESFQSHADGKHQLFDYIEIFYNQKRRHSALGYVSPAEYERAQSHAN
jgi:putative transposase